MRILLRTTLALALLAAPALAESTPTADSAATTDLAAATALEQLEQALEKAPNDLQLGNRYRQTVIQAEAYERSVPFFEHLVAAHPTAQNAFLNLGYALVDKIPSEGAITQVLLANSALGHFSAAIEREETWLALFTRGNSYLYWPPIFGRTQNGMDDLQRALELIKDEPKLAPHARVWMALGDGHWRLKEVDKANAIWQQAAAEFPQHAGLKTRLELSGEALDDFFDEYFDPSLRVDTDLSAMVADP